MTANALKAFALLAAVIVVGTGTANAATCSGDAPRATLSKRIASAAPAVRVTRAAVVRPVRVATPSQPPATLRPIVSAPTPTNSSASFSSSVFSGISGGGDGGGGGGGPGGM